MALNFHQLHIFFTVAEKGSFSAAAHALHMTQPAVTMQVQGLEDYFGTKLFNRSTKRVELSEAGKALLPFASKSIELIRETDQTMSKFTHQLEGTLQLGASLTVGEYILPRLLGPFGTEFPYINVRMKVMNTTQIVDEVLQHSLNFGIVEAPVHHAELHTEAVMSDELELIIPNGHPLSALDKINLDQILEYPFVLRERGSGTRMVMEEGLKQIGFVPEQMKIVMELGSTGAVKSAVEAGLGITVLSTSSVKHEVALGLFQTRKIEGITLNRKFYAVYLKSNLLPISAVTFLTFLREHDLNRWL